MSVVRAADAGPGTPVILEGTCPAAAAATPASLLLADPAAPVDWGACTRMHTAVFQVLLRLRPVVLGACGDPFVARWLAAGLARQG